MVANGAADILMQDISRKFPPIAERLDHASMPGDARVCEATTSTNLAASPAQIQVKTDSQLSSYQGGFSGSTELQVLALNFFITRMT